MKKQYTVKEVNRWENETFNYVLQLTEEEVIVIKKKIKELGQGSLSIEQTDFSIKEIARMDKFSGNSYMNFIWTYQLEENALEKWKEFGDCFYKGVGLKKLCK